MKKQSIILALMLMATLVVGAQIASAEDSVNAVAPVRKLNEVRQAVRDDRQEVGDDRREAVTGIRTEAKAELKDAKTIEAKREILKTTRLDVFKARKDALVKQLTISITNLTQIAGRIDTRITKLESEGKNLADAKELMVTAKSKIEVAKKAIAALVSYVPPTTTSADASATVQLEKPRKIGADAIKAVKEAREALRAVVKAITKVLPPVRQIKKAEDVKSVDASVSADVTVTQ